MTSITSALLIVYHQKFKENEHYLALSTVNLMISSADKKTHISLYTCNSFSNNLSGEVF